MGGDAQSMMGDKAIKRLAFNSIQYKELKPMVLQPYMVIILCASPPKHELCYLLTRQGIMKYIAFNECQLSLYPVSGQFARSSLTSFTIPGSLTTIEDGVFYDNNLASINIPGSVTTIGENSFYRNDLTSVAIPNSVTYIGNQAFYGNQITGITVGNSVETIGVRAFSQNKLTNVNIPNSVRNIGHQAFFNNTLASVIIGNNITYIGGLAFGGIGNYDLTTVTINGSGATIGLYAFPSGGARVSLYFILGIRPIT